MSVRSLPSSELLGGAMGMAALCGTLFWVEPQPGPGPLGLCAGVACVYAAWLAPAVGRGVWPWGLFSVLLSLPALAAASYGHSWALRLWAVLLVAAAALCGAAGRRAPRALYLATVAMLFALPFFLGHVVAEFGDIKQAGAWEAASPFFAALRMEREPVPTAALLALLVWPMIALVLFRRRS